MLIGILVSSVWLLPFVHQTSGWCPLKIGEYRSTETVPIVYGLLTTETRLKAETGTIMLGGRMLGSATSVFPHCFQPVIFRDWEAEYLADE